jgi:hypothetical protein
MNARFVLLLSVLIWLASANALRSIEASSLQAATMQARRPCCDRNAVTRVVTADQLLAELASRGKLPAEAMFLPTIPCINCIPIDSTEQYWCVLRPPGTDCSPSLPWNNNFERKRWLYWYDCPGDDIAICCSPWQDNDCCNWSDEEPPCSGGGATHRCSEVACP